MERKHGMAVAAMVLGIVSVVMFILSFTYVAPPIGLIAGVIAIVLGVTARKANPSDSMATVGLILGLIGIVLCFITTITCTICTGCSVCNAYNSLAYMW